MDAGGFRTGPEALLEHAAWARRLARSLVADAAAADDVVQETWLAALRRPPEAGRPARPWLARVLRNVVRQRARGEGRRAEREAATATPEALPGPEELAERLDSQRALAEELARIAEPYRSTVLLRYLEGLEPAEIARRQDLPGGTVRWRLKRGLDELRTRLDARFGDRRQWALLLVPLARPGALPPPAPPPAPGATPSGASVATSGGSAAALTGALVVKTSLKLVAAGAAVVVAVTGLSLVGVFPEGWVPWSREAPLELAFRPIAEPAAPGSVQVRAPSPAAAEPARRPAAPSAAPTAVEPPAPTATASVLRAGVYDEGGAPLAGALLRLLSHGDLRSAPSGADGALRVELEVEREARGVTALVERAGFASRLVQATVEPGSEVHLGNLRLEPGGAVSGRVLDERGEPVAGARVTTDEVGQRRVHLERRRFFFHPGTPPRATTAADGSFLLLGVPVGFVRVWAWDEDRLASYSAPLEVRAGQETMGVALSLEPLSDALQVRGVVLGPSGAPVPHARLEHLRRDDDGMTSGTRSADAEGRFRFVMPPGARLDLTASDPEGALGKASAQDLRGGSVDVELRLALARGIELVVSSSGARQPRRFAVSVLDASQPRELHGESLRDRPGGHARFPLPDRPFVLEVEAPGYALGRLGPLDPAALGEQLELLLEPVPGLRGQVVADGAPVPGARVRLFALALDDQRFEVGGFATRQQPTAKDEVHTGEDGGFLLTPRWRLRYVLRAEREGFAPAEVGPLELDPAHEHEPLVIELGPGGAIEGRVLVPAGPDAAGRVVGVSRGDGFPQTRRVGADGSFRFERLTPGPWQVRLLAGEPSTGISVRTGVSAPLELDSDCRVEAGRTTRFDLDAAGIGACRLVGTLTLDGAAPTAWQARLLEGSGWDGATVGEAALGADGTFELEARRPGEHLLMLTRAFELGGEQALLVPLTIAAGTTPWTLDVATGGLALENVPAASADVPELVHLWTGPGGVLGLTGLVPDDAGRCEVSGVPAGPGRIVRLERLPDPLAWPLVASAEVRAGEVASIALP